MNKVMRLLLRALPAFAILCVATAADARPKPCPGADPAIDVVYVELTRVDGNVLLATLKDPVTGALSRELEIRKGEKGWFLDLAQWRTNIPFEVTRSTLRDGLRPERAGYVFSSWTPPDGVVTELEPGQRFAYTWAWTDSEPDQQTVVRWSVEPLPGGGSRIALVHDGWSEGGLDQSARDDHEGYWTGYLEDLAAILEEAG
jgi:uncharacterized protein YndB with AHSA1/START domain